LYGENCFVVPGFRELAIFTARIGDEAAAQIKRITFSAEANTIYSAMDFRPYPKLQKISITLDHADVLPPYALMGAFTGLQPMSNQDILNRWPLPTKLATNTIVPSAYSALLPPSLPFLSECIVDLVRENKLKIILVARIRRDDLCPLIVVEAGSPRFQHNISHTLTMNQWRQIRYDYYYVRPVPKGCHVKSSSIHRNFDLVDCGVRYLNPPGSHGY
jgi:hypothetical protein